MLICLPYSDVIYNMVHHEGKKRKPQILVWIILFEMLVQNECHSVCVF